ncbi:MAG: hypothetical protein ABI690_30535, partial [Chloroflexota bacterium]
MAANEGRYCKNAHFWHENGDSTRAICRKMVRVSAAAIVAKREGMCDERVKIKEKIRFSLYYIIRTFVLFVSSKIQTLCFAYPSYLIPIFYSTVCTISNPPPFLY